MAALRQRLPLNEFSGWRIYDCPCRDVGAASAALMAASGFAAVMPTTTCCRSEFCKGLAELALKIRLWETRQIKVINGREMVDRGTNDGLLS
jgi:hypothetical protein